MTRLRACWGVAGAVMLSGLSACGGGGVGRDSIVLRVGGESFTKATVDHWTNVVKRGGAFTGFRGEPHGTPEQRALALLISTGWLLQEAARESYAFSADVVDEALAERGWPGAPFAKRLRTAGQPVEGVEREIRAEMSAETIRKRLLVEAASVTSREVADFYRRNRQMFSVPETRVVDLIENLSNPSAAASLVKRIGTGDRFAKMAYHEHVARTPGTLRTAEKVKLVNAIFAAQPGIVSQPMKLNLAWTVFVVRKSIPPRPKPLAKARSEVVQRLTAQRQREIFAKFDMQYRKRWVAKTRCHADYVAPGCARHRGPLAAYEDPFTNSQG